MGFLQNINLQNAYRVAASYDFNRDGQIKTNGLFGNKELDFDRNAKKLTDTNRDGKISVQEFAESLVRGDVVIGYDREVHARTPFGGSPGYPKPGYPGGGSPYYPGAGSPPVTYPGSNYGYGGGYGGGQSYGSILGGAAVGGAVGYVAGGGRGMETGAVIGGFLGALGNIFR